MAARTRKGTSAQGWDQATRDRIKTSMLVNRLTDHVVGKCELSTTQVTAALGLLRKSLPDLQNVEMSVSGEITQNVVNAKPLDDEAWLAKYSDGLSNGKNGNGATKH